MMIGLQGVLFLLTEKDRFCRISGEPKWSIRGRRQQTWLVRELPLPGSVEALGFPHDLSAHYSIRGLTSYNSHIYVIS